MPAARFIPLVIAVATVGLALGGAVVTGRSGRREADRPWERVPLGLVHTDHSHLIQGPLEDGPAVTRKCLECHANAAREVMATSHWTWLGQEAKLPGRDEPVRVGKRNLINNFCVGVQSNWARCTSCHAGYGWEDASFDFTGEENVDCLVCHDTTGTYEKAAAGAGRPAPGVDLVAVARSVGVPRRQNCGGCHFRGGGGDAVKHGDLDSSMVFPPERVDVHIGRHDFACQSCHRTAHHNIPGRAMSVSIENTNRVACTDCHSQRPHGDARLDAHTAAVACQTCHIPEMAVDAPTKMTWDWSTAGQDLPVDDPHVYNKKKGSFTFAQDVQPEYYWYNGNADRYLQGDKIAPEGVTAINRPLGDVDDPAAKIWPFKVHRGKQLHDAVHQHLLVPKLYGEGGYWTDFDWDKAARLGSEATGLPYSGQYGFARTEMYWPLAHMVAPKERALGCTDCHGEDGRMDWDALGYPGDPAFRGGRVALGKFGLNGREEGTP